MIDNKIQQRTHKALKYTIVQFVTGNVADSEKAMVYTYFQELCWCEWCGSECLDMLIRDQQLTAYVKSFNVFYHQENC